MATASASSSALPAPPPDAMVGALSKLRTLLNSKLENQKTPAQLLVAVEQSLDESQQGGSEGVTKERSAGEYYLALESMLEKAMAKGSPASLLPSTFYILAIVAPYVSAGILRARLSTILPALLFVLSNPHPPSTSVAESHSALLRSAMSIFLAVLTPLAKDKAVFQAEPQLRACWDATLNLCADSRPKVRRRAQEIITKLLSGGDEEDEVGIYSSENPHPYAARTAEWNIRTLASVSQAGGVVPKAKPTGKKGAEKAAPPSKYDVKKGRAQGAPEAAKQRQADAAGGASIGIWVCGFLKGVVGKLPEKYIPQICEDLLHLPALQHPFLTVSTFEVFEALYRPARLVSGPTSGTAGSGAALAAAMSGSASLASNLKEAPTSLVRTLEAINSEALRPATTDVQLLPPYLRALEGAVVSYARYDGGQAAWALFPALWTQVVDLSLNAKSDASRTSVGVRTAGREALSSFIRYCIPETAIKEALAGQSSSPALGSIIESIESALGRHALRFTHSRGDVLQILAVLVTRLRVRLAADGSSAAAELLMPLIRTVADLRQTPKFEHREQADLVLGAATEVCGPEVLLKELPLGLLGEDGPGKEGRAWLLPLMRGRITNTKLSHFVNEIVPLSEKLFNARAAAENSKGRAVEAKMYEALIDQLWALFPGYCDLPVDLTGALSQKFAELLTNVLYTQQSLRPSVLRGLTLLVERNEALSRSGAPDEVLKLTFGLTQAQGKAHLDHLISLAPAFLSVFSNLLTQSPSSSRGYISEVIGAYLRILPANGVNETFTKIRGMLQTSLTELVPQRDREVGPHAVPPVAHSMLDLLITLVPFLGVEDGKSLLELCESNELLRNEDAGVQKKTYRVLSRLLDGHKGEALLRSGKGTAVNVSSLLTNVRKATVDVVQGAKRDRLNLLAAMVPRIPSTELHLLPSIIPEAVLATKETNQGSRETAYDLLVQMGEKMDGGGKIKRGFVNADAQDDKEGGEGEGDDDTSIKDDSEVAATLTEYLTMVGAGLAGGSPHMISASITAFSRLIYEFKDQVPRDVVDEVISTIEVFLSSPNREIVKSVLGFVKVAIVSLEFDLVNAHLPAMVPAMLKWSPEHRAHFKAKVRHIFERLMRRFGYERILELTDEENRKLVNNIKKRKERAKRKKASREGEEDGGAEADGEDAVATGIGARAPKKLGMDAFEEALYGSESEISDSDSDDDGAGGGVGNVAASLARKAAGARGAGGKPSQSRDSKPARRRRGDAEDTYLLEDDDEPMDLLDRSASAAGRIVTGRGGAPPNGKGAERKRRPGQEAGKFSLDEETGRMVIDDGERGRGDADDGAAQDLGDFGAAGAYIEGGQGVGGHTHSGRGGAVKFNKNNKRTRQQDLEMEEALVAQEAATAAGAGKKEKRPRVEREKIGRDFRAKKAQGDVKKDGQDPFAYVPLSQIGGKKAKKGGRGGAPALDITGKGGKRR
ncbi:NUC173-domain-containing protein [Microstroma glucosiphilum]|uniref:NUC173-domain-containing protein n=1 Tax=Pseudomicrostroma glucosiphilum TaxID=1684307 RepID=A0A316TWE2_9BASI|nr:NUC173-domain-containing protein [Pseudomicrostroma glucosiphilum]PWN17759.1 NUC173-domain-containing protein [Pseudomicrostroma glucosiphilum]